MVDGLGPMQTKLFMKWGISREGRPGCKTRGSNSCTARCGNEIFTIFEMVGTTKTGSKLKPNKKGICMNSNKRTNEKPHSYAIYLHKDFF